MPTGDGAEVMVRVAQPWMLSLLCLLPVIWWAARSARPVVVATTVGLRCVVVALLVFAVSGLAWRGGDAPMSVVFLLDRSDSIDEGARARALARVNASIAAMRPGDQAGVIAFAGDAVIERRLTSASTTTTLTSHVAGSETDIEAALALARSSLPAEGMRRIVLLSDGRETRGSAAAQATMAAVDGAPIDVAIVEQVPPRGLPLAVTGVTAPLDVQIGEPYLVSVDAVGPAGTHGVVTLARDGMPPLQARTAISASGKSVVAFEEVRTVAGLYAYRASVRPDDGEVDGIGMPATAGAVVTVSGQASVLYVSDRRETLVPLLSTSGFRTRTITPEELPTAAAALLSGYACVVFDGVDAERLTDLQAGALARYVEDGGGLLLLGTRPSLSAAGYPETPLGALLPVDLRPRSGRRAPALALVLLVDKTGSMAEVSGGVRHFEFARRAVMNVFEVLPSTDSVGVIAFDASGPTLVAPLGTSHDPDEIDRQLRLIEPSGATALAPAIERAADWLRSSTAASVERRHILLISDGRTTRVDADRVRAVLQAEDLAVSVVAIGDDADRTLLEGVASETGGRAYFPEDLRELPQIVAREAVRASGGRFVDERFQVRAFTHPVLAGIDRTSLPVLAGYTVSALRPSAETILGSHVDDPILAAWRVGLGRVGVFTADLGSETSAAMRDWEGFASFWRQTVRWLGRRTGDRALEMQVVDAERQTVVRVDAYDANGTFLNQLSVGARVRAPDGQTREVTLRQVAPGRYETAVEMRLVGPHVISIGATDVTGEHDYRTVRGIYRADRERLPGGSGTQTLRQLAEMTGGVVLAGGDNPFHAHRSPHYRELWTWLVAAALLLFVGDVLGASELPAHVLRSMPWRRPARYDVVTERVP